MSKQAKAILEDNQVFLPDYDIPLTLSSTNWLEFLENNRSFKVHSSYCNYSVFKDSKNYWIAQKRAKGKLRAKRLGNSQDLSKLSFSNFESIGKFLSEDHLSKDELINELTNQNKRLESECNKFKNLWQDTQYQLNKIPSNTDLETQIKEIISKLGTTGYKPNSASKLIKDLKNLI